jgi:leucyl aminopeptidase
MPKVKLVAPSAPLTADAVVVGVVQRSTGVALAGGADTVDAALGKSLAGALDAVGAKGKADEVVKIPTLGRAGFPLVVATGLGADPDDEAVRRGVGAALRQLGGKRTVHIAIDGSVRAIAEGAALGGYTFTRYKSQNGTKPVATVTVPGGAGKEAKADVRRAAAVTDAPSSVAVSARSSASAPAPPGRPGWCGSRTGHARPPPRSPWWARASRSTPAD